MAYGITGPAKQKGLFGKKFDPLAYSTGIGDDLKVQHSPEQRQAQQPVPEQKKPGFLGKGGTGRAIAGTIGDYLMQRQGMDPVYAPTMMMQQQQEAAARQAQLQRAMDLADYEYKKGIDQKYATPKGPNLREDNAGNVWQFDEQTGRPIGDKPVWVDPTEKVIYQDGMQIRVPNPYRSGGTNTASANLPTVNDQASYDAVPSGGQYRDAQGNVRTKQGGPSQPATGNFPRIGPDFLNGLS